MLCRSDGTATDTVNFLLLLLYIIKTNLKYRLFIFKFGGGEEGRGVMREPSKNLLLNLPKNVL